MTTENNKIIAEFMGLNNLKDSKGDAWDYFNAGKSIYALRTNNLQYHSDWNWLMEVVEKIFSTVDEKRDNDDDWDFLTRQIRDSFYFPNKENVYSTCLDFIKWYNQQN